MIKLISILFALITITFNALTQEKIILLNPITGSKFQVAF